MFVVEVRNEHGYGSAPGREMAARRADHFAAGTFVAWDVDLQATGVVPVAVVSSAAVSRNFGHGEVADADAAVPGSRFPVDKLFAA